MEKEFHELVAAIESAGKHAREYFESNVNPATQKEDGSLVTEIDERIERLLREHIEVHFPEDTIVGEEGDTKVGASGFVWFIDPIDGTDNFVRKIPFFCVTAVRLGPTAEGTMSVVHNPISGQTFASLMENGSYENEHLCNLTAEPVGSRYMVDLSVPSRDWLKSAKYNLIRGISDEFGKATTLSSGLLGYAFVASGRVDALLQFGLKGWDSAAGLYLVRAAGGAISVFRDGAWQRYDGLIQDLYDENYDGRPSLIVSHPDIHDRLTEFVGDPQSWAT